MWVGMSVWYLKISRDPDHVAEREWYQIEAEHIQRRLGTIRKFLHVARMCPVQELPFPIGLTLAVLADVVGASFIQFY